jgi:hypothetical protein
MSIHAVIRMALRDLVDGRCYPSIFPQDERGNITTKWPAIRYAIVSAVPPVDSCGTGDTSADDTRVQIDCVAKTDGAAQALLDEVIAALIDTDPPCVRESHNLTYDIETRTHRATVDYTFYASSLAAS